MKGVIFVCLLSLSVSLSLPSPQQEASPTAPTVNTPVPTPEAKASPAQAGQAQTTVQPTGANETKVSTPATVSQNVTAAVNNTAAAPAANVTVTPSNDTKPAEKDNKTDIKPDKDAAKPVDDKKVTPQAKTETTSIPPPTVNNGTNADNKDGKKNETTTPKGEIVSPTVAPTEAQSRAFDGPSFIGGIILTLGLLAIGFMGFKYYKNQTERNYHTL